MNVKMKKRSDDDDNDFLMLALTARSWRIAIKLKKGLTFPPFLMRLFMNFFECPFQ